MFRNLLLAILIAAVLTYSFGHIATEWFDFHLSLAEYDLEPFAAILAATGIVVILVVLGFVIAFSILATIAFTIFALIIGVFVAGLSVFWPVILFSIVIFLLVRDKRSPTY